MGGTAAVIIAILFAIVVAQAYAFHIRETGVTARETIESGGGAFRWTLGVALAIYLGHEAIDVLQQF